jgi:tRNA A37 threonylcarbamoyltransferase TsaD
MEKNSMLSDDFQKYIAYEFEETATDILSKKLLRAVAVRGVKSMYLAG